MKLSEPVQRLEAAVKAAAVHLWERSQSSSPVHVTVKADHTLVLNLDIESNKILLGSLAGQIPIVSEEDEATHRLLDSASEYFVIDPLDGTTSCKRFLSHTGGQIGFGPLAGYVKNNQLCGAVFFHVPLRTLFIAERGVGSFAYRCSDITDLKKDIAPGLFERLQINEAVPLIESAVLFYAGIAGELRVIEYLRQNHLVENVYRFGGFANDCTRLAQSFEQVQVQFAVKAWDLSAALISEMAGLQVILDPKGKKTPLADWKVTHANPLISAPQGSIATLLDALDRSTRL